MATAVRTNRRYVVPKKRPSRNSATKSDDGGSLPSVDTVFLRKLIRSGDRGFVDELVGKNHTSNSRNNNTVDGSGGNNKKEGGGEGDREGRAKIFGSKYTWIIFGMVLMYVGLNIWELRKTSGFWNFYMKSLDLTLETKLDPQPMQNRYPTSLQDSSSFGATLSWNNQPQSKQQTQPEIVIYDANNAQQRQQRQGLQQSYPSTTTTTASFSDNDPTRMLRGSASSNSFSNQRLYGPVEKVEKHEERNEEEGESKAMSKSLFGTISSSSMLSSYDMNQPKSSYGTNSDSIFGGSAPSSSSSQSGNIHSSFSGSSNRQHPSQDASMFFQRQTYGTNPSQNGGMFGGSSSSQTQSGSLHDTAKSNLFQQRQQQQQQQQQGQGFGGDGGELVVAD